MAPMTERIAAKIDSAADDRIAQLIAAGQLPDYFADMPTNLAEISEPGVQKKAGKIIAGGTDLFVQQAENLLRGQVQFIESAPENGSNLTDGAMLVIPANSTMEALRRDAIFRQMVPQIDAFAKLIASKPIRERATLAGNIVNASPIADFTMLLLALNATLELHGENGRRLLKLEDFYLGYKKLDLGQQEHLEKIHLPQPRSAKINFEKVSRRTHLDIASVNSAACFAVEANLIKQTRISAGGVAPVPLFLRETSAFLSGQKIENATVEKAMHLAAGEISPISDVRGSAAYKTRLLQQLIFAHFQTLFPEKIGAEVLV